MQVENTVDSSTEIKLAHTPTHIYIYIFARTYKSHTTHTRTQSVWITNVHKHLSPTRARVHAKIIQYLHSQIVHRAKGKAIEKVEVEPVTRVE